MAHWVPWPIIFPYIFIHTGLRRAVGNVSGNRCESNCRSRGREFDPGPVPYFRGDISWNNFYGHSPLFRWIIQEGLLSFTSESMCTKYWLTACLFKLAQEKSVVMWTDRPAMTIAVDLGRKATKQTNIFIHNQNGRCTQAVCGSRVLKVELNRSHRFESHWRHCGVSYRARHFTLILMPDQMCVRV